MSDVLVCGGGVIGLSVAWRLAVAGATVTLVDPNPGGGATRAAAGMLAPVTEAHYGEEGLLSLNLASAHRWTERAAELEASSGEAIGYDATGTLAVAFDASDMSALDHLHRFQQKLELESTRATASVCRAAEPLLAPSIRGGLEVPGDRRVEPRRVAAALLEACRRLGVTLVEEELASLEVELGGGRCSGGRTTSDRALRAGTTVLATGWQAGSIRGLPDGALPPVRPVKGQILRLRLPADLPHLGRTVRAIVRGSSVYLVPRDDREVVVGATVEELGDDRRVTAGAVYSLLRDAIAVVPGLAEAELVECVTGLRPGTPDNAPLVGPGPVDGLLLATGHYRNGVLLAPVTADIVCELVEAGDGEPAADGAWAEHRSVVDPGRFMGWT